jgi:hypothetical protein
MLLVFCLGHVGRPTGRVSVVRELQSERGVVTVTCGKRVRDERSEGVAFVRH